MANKIKIESSIENLNPALRFIKEFSIINGLPENKTIEFTTAVDEILSNVILHGYKEEKGEVHIEIYADVSKILVKIHEYGEPFDIEKHKYNPEKAKNGNFEGAGLKIAKELTDNFLFLNLGNEGKEFQLEKKLPRKHITEIYKPEKIKKEEPTGVSFQLGIVAEDDAEDIAKLIYRAYGYTYAKTELYYPEKIKEALRKGEKFGVIVKTKEGEAVGYFAVLRSTDSNIGEVGEVVVSPNYRGKGLMKLMMNALIELAKSKGLLGLFGEAVTVHTISQKVNAKYGFKSTALIIGMFPYIEYKGFKVKQPRISVVIDFLHLVKREKVEVYLPNNYKNIIKEIYENMGIKVINKKFKKLQLPERSKVETIVDFEKKFSLMIIRKYGKDIFEKIKSRYENLKNKGIECIMIDIPLDNPYTKKIVPQLNEIGFFFSGIMPLFHKEKDYLRMQNINLEFKPEWIHVYSDMAQKLKKFVFKDMKKWQKL